MYSRVIKVKLSEWSLIVNQTHHLSLVAGIVPGTVPGTVLMQLPFLERSCKTEKDLHRLLTICWTLAGR